ncbi:MAG: transglutaminase domain-containing protein [Acidobacteria bacterium]|nr:transglutaminase domain-containing protein [Acidobacteriota bacterium]
MTRRLSASALAGLALALLAAGALQMREQRRQDEYVRAVTREVLAGVPDDFDSKVIALRDYVRAHVRNVEFWRLSRPFLRDTAADTLRTGKGRCGEASRVFVNMALAAGIDAQRLYLEGEKSHVVSVVGRSDGSRLIVDSATDPTYFPDLEPLAAFSTHKEFETYSTWRRTRALRRLPPNFVSLGPLAYLFENPHALLAGLCFLASASLLALAAYAARVLRRRSPRAAGKVFGVSAPLKGDAA